MTIILFINDKAKYPTTPAAAIPKRYAGTLDHWIPAFRAEIRVTKVEPRTAGMLIRKENLMANFLLNPRDRPTVIVVPERDIPGNVAIA